MGSGERGQAIAGGQAMIAPPILIVWETVNAETVRGFLSGYPGTTLFTLTATLSGSVRICGSLVPDDERQELWQIENAKAAAVSYVEEFILRVANKR